MEGKKELGGKTKERGMNFWGTRRKDVKTGRKNKSRERKLRKKWRKAAELWKIQLMTRRKNRTRSKKMQERIRSGGAKRTIRILWGGEMSGIPVRMQIRTKKAKASPEASNLARISHDIMRQQGD